MLMTSCETMPMSASSMGTCMMLGSSCTCESRGVINDMSLYTSNPLKAYSCPVQLILTWPPKSYIKQG